jgi:hypothetical protein
MSALYWARLPRRDDAAILGATAGLSAAELGETRALLESGVFNRLADAELLSRLGDLAAKSAPPVFLSAAVVTAPTDTGSFTGYASTWTDAGGPDRQGDIIARGAFAASVAAINSGARAVPVLAGDGHADMAPDRVVGRVVRAVEDNVGLWVEAVYAADPGSQTIRAKVASGGLSMSVFGPILGSRPTPAGRELLAVDLIHVLLTAVPANSSAIIMSAKAEPGVDVDALLADQEAWSRSVSADAVLASMVDNPAGMAETAAFLLGTERRDQLAELESWAAGVRVPTEVDVRREQATARRAADQAESYALARFQGRLR